MQDMIRIYLPMKQGSYQEYLLRKIPEKYRCFFQFMGQISWEQLEEILPQIIFAVFPVILSLIVMLLMNSTMLVYLSLCQIFQLFKMYLLMVRMH